MAMVREQDVFFAVGPALDFVLTGTARRGAFEPLRASPRWPGAAAFGLAMLPQLAGLPAPERAHAAVPAR